MSFAGLVLAVQLSAQVGPPAVDKLQSGDLLWPKEPSAIVLYSVDGQVSAEEQWLRERDEYLAALDSKGTLSQANQTRRDSLSGMRYRQFREIFAANEPLRDTVPYGRRIYVGHVAIVRILNNKPTVVEALWGIGVREVPYPQWQAERADQEIWHGRLRDLSVEKRAALAERAAQEVGKPYRFWNFDLADSSGFYCSKLVWLAIRDATGVIVDDEEKPGRSLWLSPKQLLGSPHLMILQDPGDYGH